MTLKQRSLKGKDVVSELVDMVFTPEALCYFKLRGVAREKNFKSLKINDIFLRM